MASIKGVVFSVAIVDIAELIEFSEVSGVVGVSGKVMCYTTIKLSLAAVGVQNTFSNVNVQSMDGIDVARSCSGPEVARP